MSPAGAPPRRGASLFRFGFFHRGAERGAPLSFAGSLLARYLRPQAGRAAPLVALVLVGIALQLAAPQVVRGFIDAASQAVGAPTLSRTALLFIGVALLQQIGAVAATYVSERLGWTATNALRADLALHCLRLDLSFHKSRTPGELIERIDGDVTALANFFTQFVIQILGNVLLLIFVLAAMWREDWRVGVVMSLVSLAALAVMNALRELAVPAWTAARQAGTELFGFIEERLAGAEDVRANGAAAYVLNRLYEFTRRRYDTNIHARRISSIPWSMPVFVAALGTLLAFGVIAYLFQQGAITLGTAFLINAYTGLSFRPCG